MVILLYLYFHPLDLTSISLTARLTLFGGRIILECVLYSSSSRLSRKSHFLFYFFFTLPFFHIFPSYPPSSPTSSFYSFFLSLTLTLPTIHPLTGAPFLSFHFRRARITSPLTITLLFYIIIYYYCLLLFYIKIY